MTVPSSPVSDDAVPADPADWPETSVSAAVPQPATPQAAARQGFAAQRYSIALAGQVAVVALALPPEIDVTNALDHCAQLCAAVDDGAQLVIADMTLTRFCDSSGFRMLLVASRIAADHGTVFRVVIPPGAAVLRALKTMALDQLLSIYASLPDAMADSGH